MLNKGDFVRVVDYDSMELKEELADALVGEEGIIISVDKDHCFPYEVVFFNKEKQRIARNNAIDFWREEELELID